MVNCVVGIIFLSAVKGPDKYGHPGGNDGRERRRVRSIGMNERTHGWRGVAVESKYCAYTIRKPYENKQDYKIADYH